MDTRNTASCLIGLAVALCSMTASAQDGGTASAADPSKKAAQEATAPVTPSQTLGTIVVTGTHIRGVDLETEHPLVVLDHDAIARTGLTGVAEIVQSLIVANGQTLNRNINNGGNGQLRVDLRSLGADRTLVLVDGHRWASSVDGAVDLSAIPLALVERIEVLEDGASAIYGSDAIGGVVNIITRRHFQGAQLDLHAGSSDHGDGHSRGAAFSFGHNGQAWNAAFGAEWQREDPVMAVDRRISAVPAPGLPLDETGGPNSQYGVFRVPELYGSNPVVLIPGRPGTSLDDFRIQDVRVDRNYNFVPYNYLRTPQQRKAAFGKLRWNISPTLAFSGDVLFKQRQSAQQIAPPVILFSEIFFLPGQPQAFGMSPQSVYNPFGVSVASSSTRGPDSRPRHFEQTVDTLRFHLGLDGVFSLWGSDWTWNVDATRTRASQREAAGPYFDNSKLALALGPSFFGHDGVARCGTPAAPIAGCVPFDLFGGPDRYPPELLDYLALDVVNRKRARSDALDATISGTLAMLPSGPLGFAGGLERRLESGSDTPDPLVASGLANGTGQTYEPTRGAYAVNEAYLEFNAPLLAGHALARQLDLSLATRWSRYSYFGNTANSHVGLRWKPFDDLLLRGNWAQGFRAPSIFEAFGGSIHDEGGAFDPCAAVHEYVPTQRVLDNCRARGVPADVQQPFFIGLVTGSNRELRPETSRSLGLGAVYSPGWLPGLDISADWYRIRIRDAIGNPGPQYFVEQCYERGDDAACGHVSRFPDGTIGQVVAINENLPGGIETDGVDFTLAWKRATARGDLELSWDNAYVNYWGAIGKPPRYALLPDGTLSSGNIAGHIDPVHGAVWRLRSVATLAWRRGRFGASVSGRYFSPLIEDCSYITDIARESGDASLRNLCSDPDHLELGDPAARNRVGAVTYVDLQASWKTPWQAQVVIGVRNALDREPPLSRNYTGANSFVPDYDIPGRYFYLNYRQEF